MAYDNSSAELNHLSRKFAKTGGKAVVSKDRSEEKSQKNKKSLKLTSTTKATQPKNPDRTTIGVGEVVTITSNRPVKWTNSSPDLAKMKVVTSTKAVLTAYDKAGQTSIVASAGEDSATISFTIIQPEKLAIERIPGSPIIHKKGRPGCGWYGQMYIQPSAVNFYNIQISELDSKAVGEGSLSRFTGMRHGNYPNGRSHWLNLGDYDSKLGSYSKNNRDTINLSIDLPKRKDGYPEGYVYTPIQWQWKVNTMKNIHDFPLEKQEHWIYKDGSIKTSKAGHSETAKL
ncbi:MAG: hypothetical protein N4Q30_00155 [Neisseriaceae bacterium]|nr:hypothetical protein [Neisseriaceae bacterium]